MSFVQLGTHTYADSVLLIDYMLTRLVSGYQLKINTKDLRKQTKIKRCADIILEQIPVKLALCDFGTKIDFSLADSVEPHGSSVVAE